MPAAAARKNGPMPEGQVLERSSDAAGGARTAALRSPLLITALLALLTAVGPISTDMYLPAFPAMRESLHAHSGQTQMTLAAWFLGLSIGQLTHGQLADTYGRRLPLLLGTLLYTAASIGCALSPDMNALSWWRLWAAFGAAASLVIPRAVIADVVENGREAARMIGRMVTVMGIVPVLAPTAGALVTAHAGWRAIFWIAAGYGVLCSLLIFFLLPETHRRNRMGRLRVSASLERYVRVWRELVFRTHSLEGGFATFSLFAFLGGAPLVFIEHFHLTPVRFGAVFVLNALGYIVGIQLNTRMVDRLGMDRALSFGTLLLVSFCTAMLVMAITGLGGALGLAIGMGACMSSLGFVLPGAALGSVLNHPGTAGAASALYGTVVFFIGALSTAIVGWIASSSPVPMTALMLVGGLAALSCDRTRPRSPT